MSGPVYGKPVRKHFTKPSLTKQASKDECDINKIMAKQQKTGLTAHVSKHQGYYGDFMAATDYHSAMNQILAAGEAFNSVPAEIRAQFDNDPGKFLEFCQNPENEEPMRELGLLPAKVQEDPSTLDPAPTPPQPASTPADVLAAALEAVRSPTAPAPPPAEQTS